MRALKMLLVGLALSGALWQAGCAERPTASRSEGTEVEQIEQDEQDEPPQAVPSGGADSESEEGRDEPVQPEPCGGT